MGISAGFSVGMGWLWDVKSNSHGSPGLSTSMRDILMYHKLVFVHKQIM